MKIPSRRGSGSTPQRKPEPPPLTEKVYEDFRAVEQNLRRYVDYRLADLAPLDGTFYRRRRVEIWSVLIILTLLATTGYETWTNKSPQSAATSQEDPEEGKSEAPERSQPMTPDGPVEPEPNPATEQEGDTREAISGTPTPLSPIDIDWEEIRKNPNDSWALYLKTMDGSRKGLILDYMKAIAEERHLSPGRVTNGQKNRFESLQPLLKQGSGFDPLLIRKGLFEYLLVRRMMEEDYELGSKSPRIDLEVVENEYPADMLNGYSEELAISTKFGGRQATKNALHVAIVISEIERGTRP